MSAAASGYSEDALVEQPAIALFAELGWETLNAFHEVPGPGSVLGRDTNADGETVRVPLDTVEVDVDEMLDLIRGRAAQQRELSPAR